MPEYGVCRVTTMEQVRGDVLRAARFDAAMSERTAAFTPGVAATYDFSRMRVIADIGGGQGTLLAAVLHRHQHLRGILFDVADVAHRAGRVLREAGVADRCEIIAGDFFAGVPAGADGYLLANVLHDWDDRLAAQILRACRRAMRPGARVLIIERLIPPQSTRLRARPAQRPEHAAALRTPALTIRSALGMTPVWYRGSTRAPMPGGRAMAIVGGVRHPPGMVLEEGAPIMFLLAHSLHLSGPLAVLLTVAMIALRVFMRRTRGSRGRNR